MHDARVKWKSSVRHTLPPRLMAAESSIDTVIINVASWEWEVNYWFKWSGCLQQSNDVIISILPHKINVPLWIKTEVNKQTNRINRLRIYGTFLSMTEVKRQQQTKENWNSKRRTESKQLRQNNGAPTKGSILLTGCGLAMLSQAWNKCVLWNFCNRHKQLQAFFQPIEKCKVKVKHIFQEQGMHKYSQGLKGQQKSRLWWWKSLLLPWTWERRTEEQLLQRGVPNVLRFLLGWRGQLGLKQEGSGIKNVWQPLS